MFKSRAVMLAVIAAIVVFVCGCAKEEFPRGNVTPVLGFHSALKPPIFKSKASAKEFYNALAKYYDSFDSCAVSFKPGNERECSFYAFKAPNRQISIYGNRVSVGNGQKGLVYFPDTNKYISSFDSARVEWQHTRCTGMLGLPGYDNFVQALHLSQSTIGKDPVYVLQIILKPNNPNEPPGVATMYVGKQDLLPRKYVYRGEYMSGLTFTKVLQETVFAGVTVNPELPDKLFSVKPPRGSKRIEQKF